MRSWRQWSALTLCVIAFARSADAAVVTLKNAWMRPAAAGSDIAEVYVDIVSDTALELTAASTSAARQVEIVLVTGPEATRDSRVVETFPVDAARTTRLAYLGHHLRLKDIQRDVGNGDAVPLTLTFKDAAGSTVIAATTITVRGMLRPRPMRGGGETTPPATDAPAAGDGQPAPRM